MTYLHRYGASVVYPDAIRAYTNGSRKYSHFEHVFRDKYYYMVFPLSMDAPRKIIEEHIKEVKEEIEAEIPSEFQSEILKPCAIGEDTSLTLFCKTNTDLPEKMYTGIVTHLKQDIAFDKFIRMHIDCSKKLRDKFVFQERKMDGSGVRRLITEIEQYGIYALAFLIFKEKGILCNQSWLSERIKPILDRDYSADLSDTTFSYMKIDTKIEQYITNQDWSHLDDGPITFSEYKNFYDDLSEYITEFQATPFYSTAEQKQDMDLFIQKLECINYALYGTDKLSMSDSIVELMAKEYMSFCDSIRNTQMYFEGINQTAEATMQFLVYLASKYTQNKNLLSRGVDEEKLYIVSQELSVINQHAYRAKITELRNLMRSKEPGYIDFHMFSETSPKEYLDVIRVTTGCYGSNESVYFGFFMQLIDPKKHSAFILIPSKNFFTPFCRKLGIGKVNYGIDPIRDIYLASRLKDANPFVIVYRTNDPATYGKAFTCFSEKTVKIEQSCIFDYKDALAKIEPNIIRSWQYTHTRTDIDFSYPARSINLKQKCKITLGTRLSFSDIGECAFRLQNCIFTNGGTILLPQEASRKKSNKLSPEGIVKDYNSQCYMKFDKIMEQLKSYETIPVTDMQQSVWNILEKLKFSSAFGFSNTRDLQKNYLSTFEKEGDALDVVIKILKIPGVLQRNYPGTTHDRVNECIGKIFNLKMEKLIV